MASQITFRVSRPPTPAHRRRGRAADRWTPFEKPIANAYVAAVKAHQANISEERLVSAVARNDLSAIVAALSFNALDDRLQMVLTAPMLEVYEAGAECGRTKISPRLRVVKAELAADFGVTNPAATEFAQEQVGTLITNISAAQLQMIRDLIGQRGFGGGMPPRTLARVIAGQVGLNAPQATALSNFMNHQWADLLARYPGGANIPDAQIERISGRGDAFEERLLRERGELIARTEVISAATQGQLDLWRTGQEQGYVMPDAQKVWIVASDTTTCPECLGLQGESVPIDGRFSSGDDGPPAHPQCRCGIALAPNPNAGAPTQSGAEAGSAGEP